MNYAATILNRLPLTRRTSGLAGLLNKCSYLTRQQLKLISEAHDFSASRHEGQKRQSGDAYITHPLAVASILADLHLDYPSIAAALLHDVIEDTSTVKEEIAQKFGAEIASLVDGVSKLEKLNFNSRGELQVESFRKMMLAMVQDIRVILLKLADRLHNMQTLDSVPSEKQGRVARETLEIYAPIANRLGMNSLKIELEDLGFRYAYPFRYRVLDKAVRRGEGNQRQFVKNISEKLKQALREAGLQATVTGRKKHLYSIYRKMETKKRSMADIADVFGFRVIVDSVDECYRVLGVVHRIYKPMPGRFKDYIAIPRINGYQSLHTSLFGPNGTPIEVQIRTTGMARVAESGVAAHWQYKDADQEMSPPETRAREWLASIDEIQSAANSEEFMEHVKVDLFPDAVYIFTPKGEIMRLPRGATCVDFAYAVHTDVGNRCVAAKIDRRLVPLRTQIENGETVEIITAKTARPNPSWVNFVVTAKARTAVRQYLKNLRENEAQDLGRRLLDQAMRDAGTPLRKISDERIQTTLTELKLDSADELFRQLGLGERLAPLVAKTILQPAAPAIASGVAAADQIPVAAVPTPIAIAGTEGLVVSYARCCHPIPGDPIMGYLSAGRGVVIHRNVCGNLSEYRKQPNKWITVGWQPDIDREFSAELRIDVDNRPGVLADVASRIADAGSNIEQVSIDERHDDSATMLFSILVRNRKQLAGVIRSIRRMKVVKKLSRTCT